MLKKKKKYLISSFEKLKYPKGSELFFIDEYLFHLQTKKIRSFYKCSYINSFDEMYKITYNSNILFKKKLKIYRKEIVNLLNSYHKTRYPIKYWGLIIDQVLLLLIQTIYIEVKLLSKIKEKNLICNEKTSNNFFFDNSINTIKSIYSGNLTQFLRPLVMKELGFKNLNLKYRKLNKRERDTKKKRYKLFLNFFIKMYLYLFKPILIVDGYLGLKNTIYLFFRSFGKILNIPKKILFDDSNENFVVDKTFRQNIKVQEKDLIDKVFNKAVQNFLPLTFFENYSSIKQQINILSNHIKKIGTGNLHYYHEHFNILAAEILQKDGKLLTFQHGGGITTSHSLLREYKDKEYASKTYYFNDKNGLGSHYYYEKKISLEEIEKRRFVLILNTAVCFNRWFTLKEPNHPQLEPSQLFFSKLEKSVKKKVLVKLFPQEESFEVKKMWTKKFSNKIKFLPFFSDAKKKRYYDAKIVILNEISTPLFDVIYLGLPFILIYNPINYIGYKNIFKKKLKNLKKINLVFDNPTKGANFINSLLNKNEFALWWKKVSKTKIFLDFKKYIIIENKNYLPMLIKDLNRT